MSDDYRPMSIPVISRSKPVAEQVQDIIRERILHGIYAPEQRIPSEEKLATELQVSRATLRSALTALTVEGYIRRRQGDGTYVCPDSLHIQLNRQFKWDIERQILESGFQPRQNIVKQEYRIPTQVEAERMRMEPDEQVFVIERQFLANERPVGFFIHCFRASELDTELFPEAINLPPMMLIKHVKSCESCTGWIHFLATVADDKMAALLNIPIGGALLVLDSIVINNVNRPLIMGKEYYNGNDGFRMNMTSILT